MPADLPLIEFARVDSPQSTVTCLPDPGDKVEDLVPSAFHFLSAYLLFGGRGRMGYEPSNRGQTYVLFRFLLPLALPMPRTTTLYRAARRSQKLLWASLMPR